jgi:two-component system OmpR family response regulator
LNVRILIVEDDSETAEHIASGLAEEGHEIELASDGLDGLARARHKTADLLIIDRMLPNLDGLSLVAKLRADHDETPVLFLTAMSRLHDRVTGLQAGGDDYLVKPFEFAELVARVAALGRRPRRMLVETTLKAADLELDLLSRRVRRAGREILLQPREFRILEYLVRNQNNTVTRAMLLENVWEYHFDPRTNIVESHLSRLRTKVDKGFTPELIHTIRGTGYCLRVHS